MIERGFVNFRELGFFFFFLLLFFNFFLLGLILCNSGKEEDREHGIKKCNFAKDRALLLIERETKKKHKTWKIVSLSLYHIEYLSHLELVSHLPFYLLLL